MALYRWVLEILSYIIQAQKHSNVEFWYDLCTMKIMVMKGMLLPNKDGEFISNKVEYFVIMPLQGGSLVHHHWKVGKSVGTLSRSLDFFFGGGVPKFINCLWISSFEDLTENTRVTRSNSWTEIATSGLYWSKSVSRLRPVLSRCDSGFFKICSIESSCRIRWEVK